MKTPEYQPAIQFHLPRLSIRELVSWEVVFRESNSDASPSFHFAWMAQTLRSEFDRRHRSDKTNPIEASMMRPPAEYMSLEELRSAAIAFSRLGFMELTAVEADFVDAWCTFFHRQIKTRIARQNHVEIN